MGQPVINTGMDAASITDAVENSPLTHAKGLYTVTGARLAADNRVWDLRGDSGNAGHDRARFNWLIKKHYVTYNPGVSPVDPSHVRGLGELEATDPI